MFEFSYPFRYSDATKTLIDATMDMVVSTITSRYDKFEPFFTEDEDEDDDELSEEEAAAGLSALFG